MLATMKARNKSHEQVETPCAKKQLQIGTTLGSEQSEATAQVKGERKDT